ncbi:MAG TPA: NAD(P)/FAD-dependent oxidoreductase [Deltaproteobacteria bacterium]|nr:NAD(P)/FAD-dependent oxidoreductase [Deltaproteobacteria bacterium]
MSEYDVVVIGAGNGGLASAATLAKKGAKVALLEKHNIPGGCGTSFRRGRFEFEVALHQLSSMGMPDNPGPLRGIFKDLGIEDQIDWIRIQNLYRVVLPGTVDLILPADKEAAIAKLTELFPSENEAIRAFYDLAYGVFLQSYSTSMMPESEITPENLPLFFKYALKSSQEVLDEFFTNKDLQLCLNAYWSFMGMPPERLPFTILAGCMFVYMEYKPFYLKGGSQVISHALAEVVLTSGSDIRYNCEVTRILTEDGKAVGVETADGERIAAKRVISNISPVHTYVNLLEPGEVPAEALQYLSSYKVGISGFTCFIGLDCPPETVGFKESMNLIYNETDVNEAFMCASRLEIDGDPMVATCYTVDDASVSPEGTSLVTLACLKYADPWIELPPEQYYETKYAQADKLISEIEKHFPGFRDHIEEMEVATPLTHMRYLNHPGGAIYGFNQDINSTGPFFPGRSFIKNLAFTSGWVGVCGFGPNYMLGYSTARRTLKNLKSEGK